MKGLVMMAVLFFAAFVQAATPAWPQLGYSAFPALTAASVYFGLSRSLGEALCAGFLAGLFQDALSQVPLGFSSLCFCVVVWTVHHFRNEVFIRNGITLVLFGAVANAGVVLVMGCMLWWMGLIRLPVSAFLLKLTGSLMLGGLATPVICLLTDRLYTILGLDYQGQTA